MSNESYTEIETLRQRVAELEQMLAERDQPQTETRTPHIDVLGVPIEWQLDEGTCTFQGAAVATMFVNPTLAGLMSGFQKMVGTERFFLAMQGEGRKNIDIDWQIITSEPNFEQGFASWARFPTLAGWGRWEIVSLDREHKECRIRVHNSFEGLYQKALGVCWGSGVAAGKCAGIFSLLFETNCWAEQVDFLARGDAYDSFVVRPSERSVEQEIDSLLATDEGTRADLAVALQKAHDALVERQHIETHLRENEQTLRTFQLLVENAPDGVAVTSIDGTITYANAACKGSTGYGDTLVGMPISALFGSEGDAAMADITRQMMEEGAWNGLFFCQHRNGHQFPCQVSRFVISSEAGQPHTFATTLRDITEQQRQEEERTALQEQIIAAQRAALREISTPLLPITEDVVVLPLVGAIDSQRAQQVMETLMEGVARYQADLAILDITGVSVVDTQVADALISAARAVRLLGARVVLTGIQPQIAQTLVHLGVDLNDVITRSTLQSGIAYAVDNH